MTFGPAAISSCRKIDLYELPNAAPVATIAEGAQNFVGLRESLLTKIGDKLNSRLSTPEAYSVCASRYLVLYSSETGHLHRSILNAWAAPNTSDRDVLLIIPMVPEILDDSAKLFEEFKILMTN